MVNLSGLQQVQELGIDRGLRAVLQESSKTVTEAEIATILRNPSFFARARLFLDGNEVTGILNLGLILEP